MRIGKVVLGGLATLGGVLATAHQIVKIGGVFSPEAAGHYFPVDGFMCRGIPEKIIPFFSDNCFWEPFAFDPHLLAAIAAGVVTAVAASATYKAAHTLQGW